MKSYWLKFGTGNPASFTGLTPTLTVFSANGLTAIAAPAITEAPASSGLYKFAYGPTLPMVFVADGGATLAASIRYLVGTLDPVDAADEQITAQGATLVGSGVTLAAMGSTLSGMGATLYGVGSTLSGMGETLLVAAINVGAMGFTLTGIGATVSGIGSTLSGVGSSLVATDAVVDTIAAGLGSTASSIGTSSVDPAELFGVVKRIQEILEGNAVFDKASGSWSIYSRGSSVLIQTKVLTNSLTQATKT